MKILKIIPFFSMILLSFESFSQNIENVYYDKFLLVEKETNEIVKVEKIETTVSFNLNTKIITITSPILIENFLVNDAEEDLDFYYFYTRCIEHNAEVTMVANIDGTRFILMDFDEDYYYIFEMSEIYIEK